MCLYLTDLYLVTELKQNLLVFVLRLELDLSQLSLKTYSSVLFKGTQIHYESQDALVG